MRTGTTRFLSAALLLLIATACSVDVSDATPAAGGPRPTATAPPAAAANETQGLAPSPSPSPTPLPWADRNVTGRLLYTQGAQGIMSLDLESGAARALFQPPRGAWLTAASLSPDGATIVMAYAPPPPEGQVQLGYTGLYLWPAECVSLPAACASPEPVPLLERSDPQESYFHPAWSPDGRHVYYAHFIPVRSLSGNTFRYTVERIPAAGGEPEALLEDAIWPRFSPDGTTLAFLSFDPDTFANHLFVAGADGRDRAPVMPPEAFAAVDAHFFTPDGAAIIFSAVDSGRAPALSWLDRLLGVRASEAHNVPSDWWRVPLAGGEPERLTRLYDTGMYGDFSPDGRHIAFISASGLYIMTADGLAVTQVGPVATIGTLEWIP